MTINEPPTKDKGELEQSRAQEEQADILELTHDAIFVRDHEGIIRYWNRGAEELYGFTRQAAIGQMSRDLLHTEFPTSLAEIERNLIENGRWEGELIHKTQDNRTVVVASRWVNKTDTEGRPGSVLEINSDVTLQKQANEVLQTSQRMAQEVLAQAQGQAQVLLLAAQQTRSDDRLRAVVEAAPNGMLMVNHSGIIGLVNSQVESLFGYSREELLGKSVSMLAPEATPTQDPVSENTELKDPYHSGRWHVLDPEDSKPEIESVSFFVHPQASKMSKGDFWARRKDGTLFSVEIGLNPLAIEGEHYVLASIVDITDRKNHEQLLKQKIEELARSNEELEQFAYVCSHDLQEPLRVISNFTRLLAKRYQGKLDEKADRFIEFTIDASKRLQDLINDLLVFSRIKTKAQEFRPVDCSAIMRMVLANLSLAIEESGATVHCEDLPTVAGDTSQLVQLFQNLVANAIKFRSQELPVVRVTAHKQADFWQFAVTDNGIGLDMQFAERIFVIFQRLNLKEQYAGSGIGLAVCKSIVHRHGGRIWLESELGKGTTFYFTMPLTKSVTSK